jgi:hypothetical protein
MATRTPTVRSPVRSPDDHRFRHRPAPACRDRFFDPDDDDQRRIAKSVVLDLSTAADRIPPSFRNAHADVDWLGIRATRNFIAHDYVGTDDEVLWQAIAVQLPAILVKLGLE